MHLGRVLTLLLFLAGAGTALTTTVRAQEPAPAPESPAPTTTTSPTSERARAPRVYLAMWTTHLRRSVVALDNNWVIGLSGRGYFGATFLNSYGRRAFTGGLQRTIVSTDRPTTNASLGFRLGFITGYDGRLTRLARNTPVLPLVQPFFLIEVRRVGFEVSYTIVVVSAALSYRF